MNITSPEFSFLEFGYKENLACDTDEYAPLPKCNDLSINFQIDVDTDEDVLASEKLYVAICDASCEVIVDDEVEVNPICSMYKFNEYDTDNVPIDNTDIRSLCYDDFEDIAIENGNFVVNPFDEITSTDISFDVDFASPEIEGVTLYIGGNIYEIRYKDYGFLGGYELTYSFGNYYVYTVKWDIYLSFGTQEDEYLSFLNNIIDVNHGTTSTLVGTTFTIADIPSDSYVNNAFGTWTGLTGTTPSTNIGKSFYYDGSQLCYYGSTPSYKFTHSLVSANDFYTLSFDYTSSYNDFTGNVTIFDGVITQNLPFTISDFSGTITVSFESNYKGNHDITISLDSTPHINGFCFDNIRMAETYIFNVTSVVDNAFPTGEYFRDDLIAVIENILGIDFTCENTTCCDVPTLAFETDEARYDYQPYWRKGYVEYPANALPNSCFTYCILDSDKNVIACSNLFTPTYDCCYVSTIEYSNNEDAFGFNYPTGVTNKIDLPFFLHSPKHLVKEKIYRNTSGQYRRLSADIEKEYEVETDYLTEEMHDKLITALKHDNVTITSNRLEFTDSMSQQGDYEIDWNSKIDFSAKANFKLRRYFNGKNNNCGNGCE